MIDYARLIREYRQKNFLTQKEFADSIGVQKTTVTRWETRQFEPTIKMKKRLYELFLNAGIASLHDYRYPQEAYYPSTHSG